ncbi:DNA replication factor RFC1, C-terminal [Kalmanozyma brasiliensis GHG001]|uniref:Replication factor C subunit 1 n=1 Tax=Kalmanozyma brasiliensis (strain GHG001) TaxID=1365824 RepID=V5F257_KALBG|nr:DNA replication factor RFC1, C-terminal [Kalmanozyma brasiliensis GHG001]EST09459.1 DNA replication factor RFC1, C-terminal [Kalmanozyma brasiliensis GHG001]
MPPKKPSTPLPKGQASLSNFFGSKATGSSPASSQEARASTRNPTATTPTKNASASSTSSKYFASKNSTATKADPMVIDDSDDDDLALKPPSKPTTKATNGSMARTSPRKSAVKRKTYDQDSDDDFVDSKKGKAEDDEDDEDDFAPAPKRPATTSSKAKASATSQPPRRAAANAKPIKIDDSDDSDDFEDAPPPPKKAAASSSKKASPAKPPAKAAAKPAVSKKEDDDFVEPAAPAPAAGNKPNWREMAAKRAAGPSNPGSKEIPQGAPNCLAGLTLVFTGELSSISRDEATDLAKRYGARITGAPSSKTSYVVLGEGAGPKKVASIEKNKIATLDEDGFLDLIRTRGAGELDEKTKQKIKAEEEKIKEVARSMGPPKDTSANPVDMSNMLWTSKYAPTQMKDLVGNKAAVEKLAGWLKAWPDSYRSNFKKPGPTGMNVYRAVLISGPPGIGKTTSAHLVAKMEGYMPLEFNASDTRGKKVVENMLQDTINNKSLDSWYTSVTHSAPSDMPRIHERTVLIMDEVDGMSGGDRGGVGAINALIKKTKVPIICICNDRRNQKMRPFEHTTYNLSFRKPDANQVKSRMLSIAFKEKLKIPGEVMAQLIEAAQSDIRSVINMLSTWKLSNDTMDFDESKQLGLENSKPGLHTPFSLYSDLSSPGMFNATSRKTLNDKADLYFQDHSFVPLMVAENYVKARPVLASRESGPRQQLKHLELLRKAAASISDGDVVDRMIHGSEQHWSLMPLHAIASSVRPCSYIYGGTEGGFPSFPAWLGQNSKQQRLTRAVVDLQAKMRLVCSGSRHDVRQHYLPSLWGRLIQPMVQNGADGVDEVIEIMDEYYLAIEDRESILELGLEPNNAEAVLKSIPAPVKAGFTRKYNAGSHPIAFNKASDVGAKMKIAKAEVPDLEDAVEEEVVEDDKEDEKDGDEDDLAKDKLVKKPKAGAGAKGKGKAKGKK